MTMEEDYLQVRIDRSHIPWDFIVNSIIKKFAPEEYIQLLKQAEFALLEPLEKDKINKKAAIVWGEKVRVKELISEEDNDKFVKDLIENKPSKFKSTNKKDWVKMVALLTLAYWPKTIKSNGKEKG